MALRVFMRGVPMLCVLLAASAGSAEELRWKFAEGDSHRYELDQTTITTAMVQGQEVKTTIKQTVEMSWKVDSVDEGAGTARVAQTIDRVRVSLQSQFANFEYDSKGEGAAEGAAAMLKPVIDALVGARVVLVMTTRGEVTDVEVPDEMIEQLRNAGPAAQALQNLATTEGMKGLIGQSSLVLPEGDVSEKHTWTQPIEVPTPQGTLVMTNTFTLADAGDPAKIELSMKIDEFKVAPDAPFQMTVEEQDGSGEFQFDTDAGRIASSQVNQSLTAVISVEGQEITSMTETSATFTRLGD